MASRQLGTFALCALVGVVTAAAGYFYASTRSSKEALQCFYENRASAARVDAFVLSQLRDGETEKGVSSLQGFLDGELVSLNLYEQNLAPSDRSSRVYEDIARVRAYYERFPSMQPFPYAKEALALKAHQGAP